MGLFVRLAKIWDVGCDLAQIIRFFRRTPYLVHGVRIPSVKRDACQDMVGPVVQRDGHTCDLLEHPSVVIHQSAGSKGHHIRRLLLLTYKMLECQSRLLPEGIFCQERGFQTLNGGAKVVLNLGIQVEKIVAQSLSQPLPDGSFSDTTHADEEDLHDPW